MSFDINNLHKNIENAAKLQKESMKAMKSFSFGDISHLSQAEQEQALSIAGDIKKLAKTDFKTPEQVMEALNKINKKYA